MNEKVNQGFAGGNKVTVGSLHRQPRTRRFSLKVIPVRPLFYNEGGAETLIPFHAQPLQYA
jgi:hypothetical protein